MCEYTAQGEQERLLTQQIITLSLCLFEPGGVGSYTEEGEVQISTAETGNGRGGSPKKLPRGEALPSVRKAKGK